MSRTYKMPFRYRWMLATTIVATLAAAVCYAGQFVRVHVNEHYDLLRAQQKEMYPDLFSTDLPAYELQTQFNKDFTYWMLIPVIIAFLAIVLYMMVAIREQFRLRRTSAVITYLLIAITVLLPGISYVSMLFFPDADFLLPFAYMGSFLAVPVLFILLIVLRCVSWPVTAPSLMLSPWVGIPGYMALFVLCAGPFAAGAYDVNDPGGVVETTLMTFLLGATVLLMIFDTVLYHHALKKQQKST